MKVGQNNSQNRHQQQQQQQQQQQNMHRYNNTATSAVTLVSEISNPKKRGHNSMNITLEESFDADNKILSERTSDVTNTVGRHRMNNISHITNLSIHSNPANTNTNENVSTTPMYLNSDDKDKDKDKDNRNRGVSVATIESSHPPLIPSTFIPGNDSNHINEQSVITHDMHDEDGNDNDNDDEDDEHTHPVYERHHGSDMHQLDPDDSVVKRLLRTPSHTHSVLCLLCVCVCFFLCQKKKWISKCNMYCLKLIDTRTTIICKDRNSAIVVKTTIYRYCNDSLVAYDLFFSFFVFLVVFYGFVLWAFGFKQ